MRVVRNCILPFGGYKAMAIGPWILCRKDTVLWPEDINHEAIHWEQQKELLVIGFYILYVTFFLWELIRCFIDAKRGSRQGYRRSLWKRAYRSIAFEREAYEHEDDLGYILERNSYAWL